MKIGILTFHRAENFGATLQAYALQTYLSQQGHDVSIIDYRCPAIEMTYDVFNPRILFSRKNVLISLKHYLTRFRKIKDRIQKKRSYELFWEKYYLKTAPLCDIVEDLGFDTYIVGSDQVWNLHLTHGLDNIYFLSFPMKFDAKKIAYAASSENDPNGLLWKNRDKIHQLLHSFDYISVREEFLKFDLERFVSNPISVCLDPTFLLNKSDYHALSKRPVNRDKYVLVYHMTHSREGVALAERIARTHSYKVVEVFGGYSNSNDRVRCKSNLGPSEILGYISNAEVVITTSFHGLALSLIFNKEFWVMNHSGNYRQRNLLALLELDDRLIQKHDDCPIEQSIDYTRVSEALAYAVRSSKHFLKDALDK